MKYIHQPNWRRRIVIRLASAVMALLLVGLTHGTAQSVRNEARIDPKFERWLKPQEWQRDSDTPALSLGEKGKFDDQHIFAPHVIRQDGEFWMYYCGSQRCVDAGTYKGVAKDPEHSEKSDQRLFKARSGEEQRRREIHPTNQRAGLQFRRRCSFRRDCGHSEKPGRLRSS